MARVSMILDDVILALKKGKRVVADDTVNLSIPTEHSSTGSRRFFKLDVSEEGRDLLKAAEDSKERSLKDAQKKYEEGLAKLEDERKKNSEEAWKELNQIADKVQEMRPSRKKKESVETENQESTTQEETATSHASDTSGDHEYSQQSHDNHETSNNDHSYGQQNWGQ